MRKIEIEVHMDHVVVEGTRVDRPRHLSRSQWMASWERLLEPAKDRRAFWP